MTVPGNLAAMTTRIFLDVRPRVHRHLQIWTARAGAIPDSELRRQALLSIATKSFHCEGGGIYALLAGDAFEEAVRFIVAYQTISDYLDNLCDRSTSQDPEDFRALHESMPQALVPDPYGPTGIASMRSGTTGDTWRTSSGHARRRSGACRPTTPSPPACSGWRACTATSRSTSTFASMSGSRGSCPGSSRTGTGCRTCAGTSLPRPRAQPWGSSASSRRLPGELSSRTGGQVEKALFPWVQALHILLDYLVDQEEDRQGGDLNFCSYYSGEADMLDRMKWLFLRARRRSARFPRPRSTG